MKNLHHTTVQAATHTASRALRMLAVTAVVAISTTALQTAQAAPGGYGERGGWSMNGPGPRHMDRMLDSVDATAEQRARIKQITEAGRADMKAQREQGQSLREQSAALFAQPNIDARAAEALRQQMLAQQDQASKRRLQTMLDVSRVLTPEQRQKLANKMQQRRAMKERHQGERQALEGQTAR
jgi:Spy/CpxP family protein refolding chaperone